MTNRPPPPAFQRAPTSADHEAADPFFSGTLAFAHALMACPSISPNDAGCQDQIIQWLQAAGFECVDYSHQGVRNLVATHGHGSPCFAFAGHTDVVPPGPLDLWQTPPFTPTLREGYLWGRGACDMKGALAAQLQAGIDFCQRFPNHLGTLMYIITSDEEGAATAGTAYVVQQLQKKSVKVDYCVIGEPTSVAQVADTVKIGRRGSLNGVLTVEGQQGHIAYPQLAKNPIHAIAPLLQKWAAKKWDDADDLFPATQWQLSNIHAGTGAENVIPARCEIHFNFRYSPRQTVATLQQWIEHDLQQQLALLYQMRWQVRWRSSALPFRSATGLLLATTLKMVERYSNQRPEISASGGTSDGRFLIALGCELLELGVLNATAHQVNECVAIQGLKQLTQIYSALLQAMLGPSVP